jgi:hypothetical protein
MTTLLIRGHGRWGYLESAIQSLKATGAWYRFDRTVLSLDNCLPPEWQLPFDEVLMLPSRSGLSANLKQGWETAADDDWVFDTEEDFEILDCPLEDMMMTMDAHPHVANMVLMRQPVSMEEHRAGGVLGGQHLQGTYIAHPGWIEHKAGYWLNPGLVRGSLLKALIPSVEWSLTIQCLDRGLSFGYWGGVTDPPRCIHIGDEGGMGSPGWIA